jgi:hypothetical protein
LKAHDLAENIRGLIESRAALDKEIAGRIEQFEKLPVVRLKVWIAEEAERCGLAYNTILQRVFRGRYPELKKIRLNHKLVFVLRK